MREVLKFNDDWLFSKEKADLEHLQLENFVKVNVPHTWNNLDGQDGGGDYYRGICLYVKNFNLTDSDLEKELFLEFNGVNAIATIYINGNKAGYHEGGFSIFRIRLNDYIKNGDNQIVVSVSNEVNDYVYPQFADFTFYGGIYRNVHLIKTEKTHFDLEYYGSKGLVLTPLVQGDNGSLNIKSYLKNPTNDSILRIEVYDSDNLVAKKEVKAHDFNELELEIKNIHLWNGRKDPYLYEVKATILQDDKAVDSLKEEIGFRYFKVDSEKGFYLNGKKVMLRGVSRHQDRENMGWAITEKEHLEDMELIKEVGANTIRLAHYQHDQFFYSLCDKAGMAVWAEIPYISAHMDNGKKNVFSQMLELIIQNYNHPSIMFWGLSNEITMRGETPNLIADHKELNSYVKSLDNTRLTTLANVSMTKMESEMNQITDILSYNHYFGWYAGKVEQNGPWLDKFHGKYPNRPLGLSEYGCEAILDWHTETPKQGDYSEEYQAYYHEEMLKTLMAREYIWSSHVWNMFDFAADSRNEGGKQGRNHKGLVTYDRKTKKDSFYIYKAYWNTDDKFVHICSKRYEERSLDEIIVKVYSNLDDVKLTVNGSEVLCSEKELHIFKFKVKLADGENIIVASSGKYKDETKFIKVAEENIKYHFSSGSDTVTNWFEDGVEHKFNYYDGYLSINTPIEEILTNPLGKEMMLLTLKFAGKKLGMGELGSDILEMIGSMTIARMANLMGKVVTPEVLYKINEVLNKLKPNEVYNPNIHQESVLIGNASYDIDVANGYLNLNSKMKLVLNNKVAYSLLDAALSFKKVNLGKIKGLKKIVLGQLRLAKLIEKSGIKLDSDLVKTINNIINKIKI